MQQWSRPVLKVIRTGASDAAGGENNWANENKHYGAPGHTDATGAKGTTFMGTVAGSNAAPS